LHGGIVLLKQERARFHGCVFNLIHLSATWCGWNRRFH
jgi:hypothetical protein